MNPEIQKELLSWLQGLRHAAEAGTAFVKDQIPLVLWEKILADRVYYTVVIISGFLAFGLCVKLLLTLAPKSCQDAANAPYDTEIPIWFKAWVQIVGGIMAVIYTLVVFCNNTYPLLLVWFAPRVYIIDWLKEMLK